jgi:hypothetical protein
VLSGTEITLDVEGAGILGEGAAYNYQWSGTYDDAAGTITKTVTGMVNTTCTVTGTDGTFTASVTVQKDGSTWAEHTGTISLRLDDDVYDPSSSAGGVNTFNVPSGTYSVFADGTDTGIEVVIDRASSSAVVDYYTVTYNIEDNSAGTSSGSTISSTMSDLEVPSGNVVLAGSVITFTAAGNGSIGNGPQYAYSWSDGASEETNVVTVNATTDITCTVTGANGTFPVSVKISLNSSNWSQRTVELRKGAFALAMEETEEYEGEALEGEYDIYVDGRYSGSKVEVTTSNGFAEVRFFSGMLSDGVGSGGSDAVALVEGSPISDVAVPTRPGYTFGGYYDAENGKGTQYIGPDGTGAVWDKEDPAPLYAKWILNIVEYSIHVSSDSGTAISPSGNVKVIAGEDKTFTFRALPGRMISAVYVDGKPISAEAVASGTYTFRNVLGNHTIDVRAEESLLLRISIGSGSGYVEYRITGGPAIEYVQPVEVPYNADLTVKAYPDEECEFRDWQTVERVYSQQEVTFSSMTSSMNLEVHFYEEEFGSDPDDRLIWLMIGLIVMALAIGFTYWFLIIWRRYYDVIIPEGMEIYGSRKAHRKSQYTYRMQDGYSGPMVYRIGNDEDSEWKTLLPDERGAYTIPQGEVVDDITIGYRQDET